MTSLVLRRVRSGGALKLVPVVPGPISEGVVKLKQVQVICPACRQQVEAVATDGRVKGYCAVVKQDVDFLIETQLERRQQQSNPENRDKHSAAMKEWWQNLENRDKMGAAHTGKHLTAETKAKISANTKKRWQDPEYRAKLSAARKKHWQDPEYRARQNAAHSKGHD